MAGVSGGHSHNTDAYFEKLLTSATENSRADSGTEKTGNSAGILSDNQLSDDYESAEDKSRSQIITSILLQYWDAYRNKVKFQKQCRSILFWGCSGIIVLLSLSIVVSVIVSICFAKLDLSQVATVITAVVSFAVLIMKLIETITSYCFPEDDEKYIVEIIQSVQTNDLERRKEHNRATEARSKTKPEQ